MRIAAISCALNLVWILTADASQEPTEELQYLVDAVVEAATERDFDSLENLMSDDFLYSFGGERSKSEALIWYRGHTRLLDEMEKISSWECAYTEYTGSLHYVCPAKAVDCQSLYYGFRAGFRLKENGSWEYAWFVAGD